MRKLTFASVASVCMVPMLFWSQDSSAIPSFARKYQTSCYTCHSGFPARNAFGEAFRNNGYRWPGGEDEEHSKQEQTKMGAEGWKKTFPESPWPSDIPGFAPLALWVRGDLLKFTEETKTRAGAVSAPQVFNFGSNPVGSATLFFGGTMGDNFSAFGQYNLTNVPTSTTGVNTALTGHIVWSFAPGINLSFGNAFSDFNFGNAITTYNSVFPSTGTSAELAYICGEKTGGVKVTAGLAQTGTSALNHVDDIRYLRAKYKIGGAGLLSGSGGTYGNEYVGLDNHVAIGATFVSARDGKLTGNYAGETSVYGADLTGSIGSFIGGVAVSQDKDLDLTNYKIDATYFIYPWMKAVVGYTSLRDGEAPSLSTALTAHLRANALISATYVHPTKEYTLSNITSQDTFTLGAQFAF